MLTGDGVAATGATGMLAVIRSGALPAEPFFFAKLPTAVIGPGEPIRIPCPQSQVDYEVEFAVVIGRAGRGLRREDAAEHIFGYTVVNDVSGRDVQFKDNQITLGMGFDTFAPMGPCIVTADEIPDPQALQVASCVNGERRQGEATANMLFPVAVVLTGRHRRGPGCRPGVGRPVHHPGAGRHREHGHTGGCRAVQVAAELPRARRRCRGRGRRDRAAAQPRCGGVVT
ncbi:MAG: fumarylacetoacetate hydrolase family protein [Micromonosporaceae bacterium]